MFNKKLEAILKEIDEEIAPLEKQKENYHNARLATWDFEDKNYLSGVESSFEASIVMLKKAKAIVTKHLI